MEALRCEGLSKSHTRRSTRAINRTVGASHLMQAGSFLLSTCHGGESHRAAHPASRHDDISNYFLLLTQNSKRVSPLASTRHFYPTLCLSLTYISLKHRNDPPWSASSTPRLCMQWRVHALEKIRQNQAQAWVLTLPFGARWLWEITQPPWVCKTGIMTLMTMPGSKRCCGTKMPLCARGTWNRAGTQSMILHLCHLSTEWKRHINETYTL